MTSAGTPQRTAIRRAINPRVASFVSLGRAGAGRQGSPAVPVAGRASADAETFGASKPRTWRIVDELDALGLECSLNCLCGAQKQCLPTFKLGDGSG